MVSSKSVMDAHQLIPLLVADVYHLAGEFRRLGNRIASRVGQTQARWQVLSVVSDTPRTVAQIARRLGYARQSVQRTTDQLIREHLAAYMPNPDHAKSPLVEVSSEGKIALARITREAERWHRKLSTGLDLDEVSTALRVLRQLRSGVEDGLGSKRAGRQQLPRKRR